ncbi:MAG: ribonuclease HII [Coriobacteriia bacterium]|nr:ribonuclease HII [Coriobacteriia bacterium]
MTRTKDQEQGRLRALFAYERALYAAGAAVVAGVDEVGRGPLAGPVSAGACVLGPGAVIPYLNDSKKLSEKRREEVAAALREQAYAWHVAHVPAEDVDTYGIMGALKRAMYEAVAGLLLKPDIILLDGRPLSIWPQERAIVKGDEKVACISAASVLAKVERDALMRIADQYYPEYGFSRNKGYGTAEHIAAIREFGLTPIHRHSFCGEFINPVRS